MKRAFTFLFILLLVSLACNRTVRPGTQTAPVPLNLAPTWTFTPVTAAPTPVPAEYQSLYNKLEAELAHFEGTLDQSWDRSQGQTIFATELAFANGNAGESLLTPRAMELNRMLLDRLQAMGVKGVVLAVKFPLLAPDFPRSSEYLQFFKDILAEAHKHGMKVLVECGAIFAGTDFSPVQVDWSKYTTESFLQGMQDQLLLIASQIKPDYLTLANEPTTEVMLTGLKITPAAWADFIQSTQARIDRTSGILVGAGTGTWEDQAFFNAALKIAGLDYIDLHIYPMGKNAVLLDRALNDALIARAAGKRVTISEAWLYKAAPQEMGGGAYVNYAEVYDRDVYGFWAPLDIRFIQDIMHLADATQMDFASFFWMRNFFTYLDYAATPHGQSTADFNRQINQAALSAVENGQLSYTGLWFQEQLRSRLNP